MNNESPMIVFCRCRSVRQTQTIALVRAQAKFELPRGTIEPSLLSFSPEQGLGSICFGRRCMEYFGIKNWDKYKADALPYRKDEQ